MKKTIGIIGGMGPMATVDLMKKVILATDAREDQEHIPILVDNNTNIPDRTAAILGEGEDPLPELLKSADRLTAGGADFLIMGCNTAHYFLPLMMPNLRIPVINMIEETAAFCAREGYKRVGLLASAGTCKSGIYQRALERAGFARPLEAFAVRADVGAASGLSARKVERHLALRRFDGADERAFVLHLAAAHTLALRDLLYFLHEPPSSLALSAPRTFLRRARRK